MVLQRLWNRVPILTKDFVDEGIISLASNAELTQNALHAFDTFVAIRTNDSGSSSSKIRLSKNRRRQQRTKHSSTIPKVGNSGNPELTVNDYFFEYQRLHGYAHGTPKLSDAPEVSKLKHALQTESELYFHLLGGASSSVISSLIQGGIASLDIWAAIQKGEGAYHKDHVHEDVLLSGVYYAKVPEGSAPIIFHKPALNSEINSKDSVTIYPKEGQVIIFPPWLLHGVPMSENENNPSRVSYAFNLSGAYADPWGLTKNVEEN